MILGYTITAMVFFSLGVLTMAILIGGQDD